MQVKSRFYYIFWTIMALAVCSGQIYVGLGYRIMSRELRSFTQAVYDSSMGWGAHQQQLEQNAQDFSKIRTNKIK